MRQVRKVLVVVPCGNAKIWDRKPDLGPTRAEHAYTGAPFKVNREYARHFGDSWVILSAKYGLISSAFVIDGPYCVTFKKKATNPISVSTLRNQIQLQKLDRFGIVIGLGGQEYRTIMEQAFAQTQARLCFPFAGLRMGKAMQATKRAIKSGKLPR
jgi:hypothetical protein